MRADAGQVGHEGYSTGGDTSPWHTQLRPTCGLSQPGARHAGGEQRAAVVGEEDAGERERADAGRHGQHLRAGAHARAEQGQVRRRAEHVAVDVFPPRLLRLLRCARHGHDITTMQKTSCRALLVSCKGWRISRDWGFMRCESLTIMTQQACSSTTCMKCVHAGGGIPAAVE